MSGQTVILRGPTQRHFAHQLIDRAPDDAVLNIREATRTTEQNAKLWAMMSDVSRAKPDGRTMTADLWKAVFMNALGHQVQFIDGIDGGQPFPVGFRSSKLRKHEMSDLIEFVYEYGTRKGVIWTGPDWVPA